MSYGDYVEQLTYLLFLKMADERSQSPWSQPSPIARGYDWPSLLAKDGDELFDYYRHTLEKLGAEKGAIGLIFGKAQNKFQDPAKLRSLWIYDLRTNQHFTLKTKPLRREHLDEFVKLYNPANRHDRPGNRGRSGRCARAVQVDRRGFTVRRISSLNARTVPVKPVKPVKPAMAYLEG